MTPKVRLTEPQVEAIRALENETGRLTPQRVVQAAKAKSSPLHSLFDWNTKTAAEKWWLQRARDVIGSVTYQYQTTEYSVRVPAYIQSGDRAGYRSVIALRDDDASARESLIYALETAAGHLRRAVDLAAPLGLSADVDRLIESVVGVQRIVRAAA